jgi:hypothetical protein
MFSNIVEDSGKTDSIVEHSIRTIYRVFVCAIYMSSAISLIKSDAESRYARNLPPSLRSVLSHTHHQPALARQSQSSCTLNRCEHLKAPHPLQATPQVVPKPSPSPH